MILSFASSKGGVGKSTTCAAVAAKLAQDGNRVLVLDLDQNQTVARWAKKAAMPSLEVMALGPDAFTRAFRDKGADFEASEPDLREALVIIDDIADVVEAGATGLQYRLLLTKLFPLPTRVTLFAHREIARHDMASFRTGLVERAQYREMFLTGKAPTLAEPKGKAAREIDALVAEIETIVGLAGATRGRAA